MLTEKILAELGYVKAADIKIQLDYGPSIKKRLDEHRELAETIEQCTDLLEGPPWHLQHLADQDDYLMRLYFLVHDEWPNTRQDPGLRARPAIFGLCKLPEYPVLSK